jgi:hypothetical protein
MTRLLSNPSFVAKEFDPENDDEVTDPAVPFGFHCVSRIEANAPAMCDWLDLAVRYERADEGGEGPVVTDGLSYVDGELFDGRLVFAIRIKQFFSFFPHQNKPQRGAVGSAPRHHASGLFLFRHSDRTK